MSETTHFQGAETIEGVLNQLVLIDGDYLLNAALMLFGSSPQQFCPSAVVKCEHYYGTEVVRPIPSHQIFGGTLFQQVDDAVDFVLSKLSRSVGGRMEGPAAEVWPEIPNEAITEIIVNAVVHRDYDSAGSVQIAVFADRVEVVNPGSLPDQLTIADLAKPHVSIPVNPFLARPFFSSRLHQPTWIWHPKCFQVVQGGPFTRAFVRTFEPAVWRHKYGAIG